MLSTMFLRFLFIFTFLRTPFACTQTGPPPYTLLQPGVLERVGEG